MSSTGPTNQSEGRFRNLLKNMTDILMEIDQNGNFIYLSPQVTHILGYLPEEIIGKNGFEFIHPDDMENSINAMAKALKDREIANFEYRTKHKSGHYVPISASARVVGDGDDIKFISVARDITERKKIELHLQIEREKLNAFFESMQDGISIVNRNFDIEYINPMLRKEFGSPEGEKCYKHFHGSDKTCSFCKNDDVFAGKTVRWEWTSPRTGKTYDLIDSPLKNADGTISKLVIFRDITDRKKAEKDLKEHINRLERFNKVTIGRELRMKEMKGEIDELLMELGREPRYPSTKDHEKEGGQ